MLPGRRHRFLEPTLAIHGYWRNANLKGSETRIEAGRDEWYWGAPLPNRMVNATVFVDPRDFAQSPAAIEAFYYRRLGRSKLLRNCLEGEIVGRVTACDAGGRFSPHPATQDSLKVGEASYSVDPLSSQGVQAAIANALYGSIVVHTLLTTPDRTSLAIQFAGDRQCESVRRHRAWTAGFYGEHQRYADRPFWIRRSSTRQQGAAPAKRAPTAALSNFSVVCLSPAARLVDTPVVNGELIDVGPALEHPSIERPVAFLNGFALAGLLKPIHNGISVKELRRNWEKEVSHRTVCQMLNWLISKEILVATDAATPCESRIHTASTQLSFRHP